MKYFLVLIVISVPFADCQESYGDECFTDDDLEGTCLNYNECEYVINMVEVLEQKPTDCFISYDIRLVCCPKTTPTNNLTSGPEIKIPDEPIRIGYKTALFEGYIWSNGIVCRFDGNFPMICSRLEYPAYKPQPVSLECPEISPLEYSKDFPPKNYLPHVQVLRDACRNYTEAGSRCVQTATGYYVRPPCEFTSIQKVSNGVPVQLREYPHMALLGTIMTDKEMPFKWWGGGSLISEYFILTAAHVLYYDGDKPIRFAMLGAIDKTDLRSGVIYQVVKIICHEQYNIAKKKNDIALLELNRRVIFTEFIRPICLMIPGLTINSDRIVAGWGNTKNNQADSPMLLQAIITEQPIDKCQKAINGKGFVFDNETMICAGTDISEKTRKGQMSDTCQGDSGGPLMAVSVSHQCTNVEVGVVSKGTVCGVGEPAVYTNVSHRGFIEWIVPKVWPESLSQKMYPPIVLH